MVYPEGHSQEPPRPSEADPGGHARQVPNIPYCVDGQYAHWPMVGTVLKGQGQFADTVGGYASDQQEYN
jgi:hypothetical protein